MIEKEGAKCYSAPGLLTLLERLYSLFFDGAKFFFCPWAFAVEPLGSSGHAVDPDDGLKAFGTGSDEDAVS